jgi:hypothetical protein
MAKKPRATTTLGISLPDEMYEWIDRRTALKGLPRGRSPEIKALLSPHMEEDFLTSVAVEQTKGGAWVIKSARTKEVFKSFMTRDAAVKHAKRAGVKVLG